MKTNKKIILHGAILIGVMVSIIFLVHKETKRLGEEENKIEINKKKIYSVVNFMNKCKERVAGKGFVYELKNNRCQEFSNEIQDIKEDDLQDVQYITGGRKIFLLFRYSDEDKEKGMFDFLELLDNEIITKEEIKTETPVAKIDGSTIMKIKNASKQYKWSIFDDLKNKTYVIFTDL